MSIVKKNNGVFLIEDGYIFNLSLFLISSPPQDRFIWNVEWSHRLVSSILPAMHHETVP